MPIFIPALSEQPHNILHESVSRNQRSFNFFDFL